MLNSILCLLPEIAAPQACGHCDGRNFKVDEDGDLLCVFCSRRLPPSAPRPDSPTSELTLFNSARYSRVNYAGHRVGWSDVAIYVVLERPASDRAQPRYATRCPRCSHDIRFSMIPGNTLRGKKLWAVRCNLMHTVQILPDRQDTPMAWRFTHDDKDQGAANHSDRQTEIGEEKCCSQCKDFWPNTPEFFYHQKKAKGALMAMCKACYIQRRWPEKG